MSLVLSSGDLRADKRYLMAVDYHAAKELEAACDLFAQCLELAPLYLPCLVAYGACLLERGLDSEAKQLYSQAAALDDGDVFGARLALARLEGQMREMSPAYVAALFDGYAPRFEKALVDDLHYVAPQLLFDAVSPVPARVLDLGCGTGLMGALLSPFSTTLVGVDLSADMVALAHKKQIYTDLHVVDLVDFMLTQPDCRFDLVIAADVFVYLGDLQRVIFEAARLLPRDGVLAFTAQACSEGFELGEDWRYAHSSDQLRAWLAPAFHVKRLEAIVPRFDKNQPVEGWLVVAQKL